MKTFIQRMLLAAAGLLLALGAAELAYRMLGPGAGPRYRSHFEDAEHHPTDVGEAIARGDVVVDTLPRGRPTWARASTFYICYRGGVRPGMDARGCVECRINKFGIRDREDLTYEKPSGQKRILCLGDSFTFGFGVPVERTWPRLIEAELRAHGDVRTVNCGMAGTLLIDEYWWALRDRFYRFDPDLVLLTICLNDLAPMPDTLGWFRKELQLPGIGWSRLLRALVNAYNFRNRTNLDPSIDYGRILLEIPDSSPFYADQSLPQYMPPEAAWKNGGPQKALRAARDWCARRKIRFGVVVWPLFQGLESDRVYPFRTLHRVVGEFCQRERIPHLDLLSAFRGHDSASLWVDPSDMHGNELAQRIAAGPIARFVARLGLD